MKKSVITGALVLTLIGSVAAPVVSAQSPTTAGLTQNQANRIAKAKKIANDGISKREKMLGVLRSGLPKYKGNMFAADYTELENRLAAMKTMLAEWRSEINSATTVDQVKSVHKRNIERTRFFRVFQPTHSLLVRLDIKKRNLAQLNKRIENNEKLLAGKNNNDKNSKFETAQKKLAALKVAAAEMSSKLTEVGGMISGLTPELANSNLTEYKKKVSDARNALEGLKSMMNRLFSKQKELKELLGDIKNLVPTATVAP